MRSTLLKGRLPVNKWYAQMGDPTVANSILDQLVHNGHRFELEEEAMRMELQKQKG